MKKDFEPGDLISHEAFPKSLGLLCEQVLSKAVVVWSVWWLRHPDIEDFGQAGYVTETYIRHFKPWRGFYKD